MLRKAFAVLSAPPALAAGYLVVIGVAIKQLSELAKDQAERLQVLDLRIAERQGRLNALLQEIGCAMGAEAAPAPYPGPVDVDPLQRAEPGLPDASPGGRADRDLPTQWLQRAETGLPDASGNPLPGYTRAATASEAFLNGDELHP
jgi:hypothetical protein